MKAVYLTKGALDIFDEMEYLAAFRKIIEGLKASMMSTGVKASDRIILGKSFGSNNDGVNILKEVLGDVATEEQYKEFVNTFKIKARGGYKEPDKTDKKEPVKDMGYFKNLATPEPPKLIKFSDDFWQMLDRIRPASDIVWDIYALDSNKEIKNTFGIETVDIGKEWYFDVTRYGRKSQIKVAEFVRNFFQNKYTPDQIFKFVLAYNKIVGRGTDSPKDSILIKPRDFKFEPTNVKETFISLVTETYPMGHEEEVVPLLTPGLKRDEHGNYYMVIGDSDTSFTCHLDTASRTKDKVNLIEYKKDGQTFIMTDGTSILGADDKGGVAILMYMIAHNIPGVYWFFMGEERGGIGSGKVSMDISVYPFMEKIKKMVSFDRRNYYSVITSQMSLTCCSNEFAESLCTELNKSGLKLNLDPTGVFTDSANFIDIISECTNVSIGYFNEHTHDEIQNISYLERLAEACVAADWSKLEVKRKVGFDDEIMQKYNRLVKSFKRLVFWNYDSIKGVDGKLVIELEIVDSNVNHLYFDLAQLQRLFSEHRLDPDIKFGEQFIKIELS